MNESLMLTSGQMVYLLRDVEDDETGYTFPAGSKGRVESSDGNGYFTVTFARSLGDSRDSGLAFVMVTQDAFEAVANAS